MGCPRCESDNISTNGTAGWYCDNCYYFFDEPWYPWEHEEDNCSEQGD